MGDYLIVNGLIRNIIKRAPNKDFILMVNNKHSVSIPFMFRDIKNLKFCFVPPIEMNEKTIKPYIKDFIYELILIGYNNMDYITPSDMMFYKQFGVDFNKRWTDFYIERDSKKEKELFDKFNIKDNEYIFLHEGGSNNDCFIDRTKIKSNLKVVSPEKGLTENIFDYCYIIEHAAEIHVIESSFLFLIDSILTNGKLYAHRYARSLVNYTIPHLKKDWRILK